MSQKPHHPRWQGRSEFQSRLGNRVHECQLRRVKGQAFESDRERLVRHPATIDEIAGDRVTERRHVNPDLVCPPRLQLHLEVAEALEPLENRKTGHRRLTSATWQD